ncbi:AP COMPLEX SUBUNIT MU [Salix purpurea]|uniref:AP COMPLEX SUBUNIT MU n=2 Tax=Salix TaxID=40685 RepID=A0A9Q0Z8R3_SALPP|nr:AP COMPLEX SUBUNIT MU [Salix purpurea]
MAFHNFLPGLLITLLATLLAIVFSSDDYTNLQNMYPFTCSDSEVIRICNASLYHTNYDGLQKEQLASIYGVSPSRINSISSAKPTRLSCNTQIFNGQVWWVENEARLFNPGYNFSMHLLCGCTRSKSQIVVTYTVQLHDTLSDISSRLSSTVGGIQSMNINLIKNPGSIIVDWLLFVPTGSILASRKGSGARKTDIDNNHQHTICSDSSFNHHIAFESEKPVIFSLEEIEEATKSFAKTKKIGEGGYGCVYHGFLRGQEVAVKKMRSNKSHEFFAELKVYKIFEDHDPETALADVIDKNLRNSYPPHGGCLQVMAGAASALFLLDIKGRVLVWRDYRGDVSAVQAERFFTKFIEKEGDPQSQDPVVYDNGVSYMFIQHSNVYLMAASRQNCNAASLISFLHSVVNVFKHYFEELEEESLRDNFVVVYELLDEMMDFGYPQYTEAKILSEFIKTDAYRMETSQRPPMAVTNAVSWRSEGINYKKNEVFLDVVESVNILVNTNGQVIRSDVVGALKMRTYLSGMPECKLGLNDRVLLEAQGRTTKGKAIDLEDIKFHQCVRLARFENDRTISFIPPDGAFDLMTYRLSTQVKPLIWVEAQVEKHSRSRVEIMVKARSQFKERSTATNVEIELPVPVDASNPNIRTSMGSASYAPENDALMWKIKSFPGGKEYMLRAEFSLSSITAEEATPERKAPIRVKFEIPYFTVSGIQVRYLKIIEKSGYQALPWVRYITMAGEYELRLI